MQVPKAFVFETDDAMKYGVDVAVLLYAIRFWVKQNEMHGKHFHDGRYWTFNTKKKWAEWFPFWSERHVKTVLDAAVKAGALLTGNYNASTYDRTLWYSLPDTVQCSGRNLSNPLDDFCTMECTESVSPIPDNIPDKIPVKDKPNGLSTRENRAETKSPYGEFNKVMLTDEEYERALAKYDGDADKLEFAINILDAYLAQDKKRERRYTSHYAVLTPKSSWVRREVDERYVPRRYIEKDFDDTVVKVF